jgi:hypothetical protein
MLGQKHTVQCRCIMNQFKRLKTPPLHKFVVFSIINDSNNIIPKFVQCNNCGIIHKVVDINRSEIVTAREHMSSIVSFDELKTSTPEKLASILETNSCDQPTWEMANFIIENQRWGEIVVMTSDLEGSTRQGKYIRILGEALYKVENFTREEAIQR